MPCRNKSCMCSCRCESSNRDPGANQGPGVASKRAKTEKDRPKRSVRLLLCFQARICIYWLPRIANSLRTYAVFLGSKSQLRDRANGAHGVDNTVCTALMSSGNSVPYRAGDSLELGCSKSAGQSRRVGQGRSRRVGILDNHHRADCRWIGHVGGYGCHSAAIELNKASGCDSIP